MKALLFAPLALLLMTAQSFAAISVNYNAVSSGITTEVGNSLGVLVPIGGIVLAIGLAWKIGKRFVRG